MKERFNLKNIIKFGAMSFLTLLAFTMEQGTHIAREFYESSTHYYMDRMIESFFTYTFEYYLFTPLLWIAYMWIDANTDRLKGSTKMLITFLSIMLVFGDSFRNINSWDYIFFDVISFAKSVAAVLGFYFLIQALVRLIYKEIGKTPYQKKSMTNVNRVLLWIFDERKPMLKTMLRISSVILVLWLPVLIICYPGGVCIDISAQVLQALGEVPFSTQHSILYTLIIRAFLAFGLYVFSSYNLGLYFLIIFQLLTFVTVLSYSLYRLMQMNAKKGDLLFVLLIYILSPINSNLATMVIKDTLYAVAVLWFVVELVGVVQWAKEREKYHRIIPFVCSAIFATLFRNNGIYVVIPTLIAMAAYLIIQKKKLRQVLLLCFLPICAFSIISTGFVFVTGAEEYTSEELLSVPFQQTARYMVEYEDDVTIEEREVLNHVFFDVGDLKNEYDPDVSDPIKRLYRDDLILSDTLRYLKVWFTMGIRHPGVYAEAFLNHCYGWFDPMANNWVRYEGRMAIFTTPTYLGSPDKAIYFIYNFLNRLPILGLLENVGFYVWGLLVSTNYILIKKKKRVLLAFIPLYISLLVCIASPAFWLHPRYAFPIMISMPFLWIVMRVETYEK